MKKKFEKKNSKNRSCLKLPELPEITLGGMCCHGQTDHRMTSQSDLYSRSLQQKNTNHKREMTENITVT